MVLMQEGEYSTVLEGEYSTVLEGEYSTVLEEIRLLMKFSGKEKWDSG